VPLPANVALGDLGKDDHPSAGFSRKLDNITQLKGRMTRDEAENVARELRASVQTRVYLHSNREISRGQVYSVRERSPVQGASR